MDIDAAVYSNVIQSIEVIKGGGDARCALSSAVSASTSTATHDLECRELLWKIAMSYTVGFLLTNLAFSMSTAAFAETIKSGEPVFVVALNLLLFQRVPRPAVLAALAIICVGVGVSCFGDYHFVANAFVCAVLSNICFGSRAVFTKQLFRLGEHSVLSSKGKSDDHAGLRLFTKVSELGMCMIIPVAMFMEGRALFSTVMGAGPDATDPATLTMCAGLMLLNGVCYACYNLMSFVVLGKTDVVTHAALNIFRRVFIIVSTSLFFGIQLTRLNVAGVLLAVFGAMAYSLAKGG